jgi:predicted ATPase/tetratricopeptide (TPR) repeat protein
MLITLAGLRLEGSGFTRPKPLLLLAYLALEGSRERRFLRDLFWPGEIDAATHLRVTLQRIRQAVPDALEMNGEWVACKVRTDAQDLLGAQEAGLSDRVLELYAGAFLAGANLPALGSELEEWVYATRELLASCVQSAWMQQATDHARKGEFALCGPPAERAYLLSGAPEPDGDRLFNLHTLLLAGESPLASDVRREAEDAGASPYANLEAARTHWQRKTNRFSARLPAPTTSFVGRNAELETVRERLTSSDCRWVTLLGPGGMGKTRLALEMARQTAGTPHFPDGVFWVPLENVLEASIAAQRIYETLVGPSNATGEPIAQIEDWLSDRSALLVLDNAEQVEGIGSLLERWAGAGEDSRWLVTSRERLQGQGEWVLTLEGLPQGNRRRPNLESDAAKLFVGRSAQIKIGKTFNAEHAPAILEVCELLDGMPLALELAATWMDVIEPAELASELREDLRVLEQSGQGKQNLRVAFDRSWNKLSERERTILASLSIFEDGFTREAAQKITGATISDLFSLVNRSLIRATSSSRYGMHPVVRSYAREKLAGIEGLKPRVQAVHNDYFFDFLLEHGKGLASPNSSIRLETLDSEINNILKAWLKSDQTKLIKMGTTLPILRQFFIRKGDFSRGNLFFSHTNMLCENSSDAKSCLHISFLSSLAMLNLHIRCNLAEAGSLINKIKIFRRNCSEKYCYNCIYSYLVEAYFSFSNENFSDSIKKNAYGSKLAKEKGFKDLYLLLEENTLLSRLAQGEENLENNFIEIIEKCDEQEAKIGTLNSLGYYYMQKNQYSNAENSFLRAIQILKSVKYESLEILVLNNLSFCYLLNKKATEGLFFADLACEKLYKIDKIDTIANVFDSRGQIHLNLGDFKLALCDFCASLELFWTINQKSAVLSLLLLVCEVYVKMNLEQIANKLIKQLLHLGIALKDLSTNLKEFIKENKLDIQEKNVLKLGIGAVISDQLHTIKALTLQPIITSDAFNK